MSLTQSDSQETVLVFVHLGLNPTQTLNAFAETASKNLGPSRTLLLTDQISRHVEFPGQVIEINRGKLPAGFNKHIQRRNEFDRIAGGYWRFTLERLFVLLQLPDDISQNAQILHLESDVLSSINKNTINKMGKLINKTSVVRYSEQAGIASILFSPTKGVLERDLHELDLLLETNRNITNDMALLGMGLNLGLIGELPSTPNENWKIADGNKSGISSYLVFDGAAFGQYLFGQDALHTNNRVISGYQNPSYPLQLTKCNWTLNSSNPILAKHVIASYSDGIELHIANLHIHSKIIVSENDVERWDRTLKEANGTVERISSEISNNHIHAARVSVKDRIQLVLHREFRLNLARVRARLLASLQGRRK